MGQVSGLTGETLRLNAGPAVSAGISVIIVGKREEA
jgi:hypothetical protein